MTYKFRIVICRARRLHVAESDAFDTGHEAAFSNEPV